MKFYGCLVYVLTYTLTALSVCEGNEEYFSSVMGLERLLKTEQVLLLDLKQFIKWTRLQVDMLERETVKIEQEHAMAAIDSENYLTNPVNAYRLIKRLYKDWSSYETRIRNDNLSAYFLRRMRAHRDELSFPNEEDALGAAMGLVRLQDTYKLNVTHMAAGILNGIKHGNGLTWQDCFTLGQQLYTLQDYNHTQIWLKESMHLLSKEPTATAPISLEYMVYVAEKLLEMGDFEGALQLCEDVLKNEPYHVEAGHIREQVEIAQRQAHNSPAVEPTVETWHYRLSEEYKLYERVCRGELEPTPAQLRPLRCRYLHNNSPFHRIAPFKVEEHSLEPLVLTIHDMLSDQRMDTIKSLAIPLMQRSTVQAPNINQRKSDVRVSKTAWLKYHTHKYMLEMLRDIHDATGLDTTYAEELQVVNYGVGGHYEPHWDFYQQLTDAKGNRMATAIFYLANVEQGGATSFPHLHLAVQPQKGNVLFWYNLHRSLDMDYRTKHAGCPVLRGSKWIANIWIRELQQTFIRPCALHRDNEISLKYAVVK